MEEINAQELDRILKESVSDKEKAGEEIDKKNVREYLQKYIERKAVLGFDIYRYSQFAPLEQTLIPHLFKKLYSLTIKNCISNETFFFNYTTAEEFESKFIDTGDGGFQIFESPFEALLFAIYFQANTVRYNSRNKLLSDLYSIVGEISLRYSLTYDNVHNYKDNYYGPAIINCARIMSNDRLNRFLIDSNTIGWFNAEINSIETCLSFEPETDFPTIPLFKAKFEKSTYKSLIFGIKKNAIKCLDILKIGEIRSKRDIISIFSAHIQVLFTSGGKTFRKYHVTLGNLNSTGLSE